MNPRTSREIDEESARTLYVRLPHTIKNSDEILNIFVGDVRVKLPRQSSRHCHVIFSSIEEKMKNLKHVKKVMVDGKRIIAAPPRINQSLERKKRNGKKLKMTKVKPLMKRAHTRTVYVSNIKLGTKAHEIKDAFPGCLSVTMLKSTNTKNGGAILKFGRIGLAGEYLSRERDCPEVNGNVLQVHPDTRKGRGKSGKNNSSGLKIYDGEGEVESVEKSKAKNEKSVNSQKCQNNDEEEAEEEDEDEEEEEEDEEESDGE